MPTPKFKAGDMVLAKIGSYQPWPAIVVPLRYVPANVYKKKKENSYCVAFFNDNSYYWNVEKTLTPLNDPGSVDTSRFEEDLIIAYEDAANYKGLEDFLRNVHGALKPHEDYEYDEECFYTKKTTLSGKNGVSKRPAPKGKAQAVKKARVKAPTPPADETPEEKRIRGHKFRSVIQKGLIQRRNDPTEEELDTVHKAFTDLEEYSPHVDAEFLKHSKLHKVLKAITKLEKEPSEHYNFKSQSVKLLLEWEEPIVQLKKEKDSLRDTPNSSFLDSHHDIKPESSAEPTKSINGDINEENHVKAE